MSDAPLVAIEQAAMRLLAKREHTQFELGNKLRRSYVEPGIDQVLKQLAVQGLQSDERYTELYVTLRRNKGYGPLRIRAELQEKGIAEDLIETYLEQDDSDWWQLMEQVALKKFGEAMPREQKEMAKRARFLSHRGFPPHLISSYLFND